MRRIADGVYEINHGIAVSNFLIDRAGGVVVVDTAIPGRADAITAGLAEIGRTPADISAILITHYHGDHTGSLAALAERTDAPVYAPKGEAQTIRDGAKAAPITGRGLLGWYVMRTLGDGTVPQGRVDVEVSDGEILDVGGGVRVVGTPGHTVDHVCYLLDEGGVLFVGDAAFNVPRVDAPPLAEDFPAAEASFVKLAHTTFSVAAMSHGRSLTKNARATFERRAARYA